MNLKRITLFSLLISLDVLSALYLTYWGRWAFNSECNVEPLTDTIPCIEYRSGCIAQRVFRERDSTYSRISTCPKDDIYSCFDIVDLKLPPVGSTADCSYGSTWDGVGYTHWGDIQWYESFYLCGVILIVSVLSFSCTFLYPVYLYRPKKEKRYMSITESSP